MKPISPDDVVFLRGASLPPEVIDVFNKLIAEHWDGRQAVVPQERALCAIIGALNLTRAEVFDRHYLDVEAVYEAEGWRVTYDKPAYNESYPATFTFARRRR